MNYDPNLTVLLHMLFGCIVIGFACFFVLIYVRSQLVFTCRKQALERCNAKILVLAHLWEADEVLRGTVNAKCALRLLEVIDEYPSYDKMWRDPFTWTFEGFFPDIDKRLSEKAKELGW